MSIWSNLASWLDGSLSTNMKRLEDIFMCSECCWLASTSQHLCASDDVTLYKRFAIHCTGESDEVANKKGAGHIVSLRHLKVLTHRERGDPRLVSDEKIYYLPANLP